MKNIYLIVVLLLYGTNAWAFGTSSGRSILCVGGTDTLTSTTPGGTWSCGSSTATIDAASGAITGVSAGTAYITYTLGASSVTGSIYVEPQIFGPSTVCLGSSICLSDSLSIAMDPLWTNIGGAIALIDSNRLGITIRGVSVGTAVISFTRYMSCISTRTITVTPATCSGTPVPGTAIIDIDASIPCRGRPALLKLSGHTDCGTTLQWQSSTDGTTWTDLPGAMASTTVVKPIVETRYRCKVTCIASGITAYSNVVVRPIGPYLIAAHVEEVLTTSCDARLYVETNNCTATFNLVANFGDGTSDTVSQNYPWFTLSHHYTLPGAYTVKYFLYDGGVLQDSLSILYTHLSCNVFPINVYHDINNNCTNDIGDLPGSAYMYLKIDSNGTAIDTMMITSGIYYSALGPPGTVYRFSILSPYAGITPCPSYILDTVPSTMGPSPTKSFGLQCSSSNFDIQAWNYLRPTPTQAWGYLDLRNPYCAATSPSITLTFSPKYNLDSATPSPTSVVGNTATWIIGPHGGPFFTSVSYHLVRPGPPLVLGDTVGSTVTESPITGDVNPSNNTIIRIDTVKSGWDPNDITVTPAGDIPNSTTLEYTVRFENTGNDTAHNIYVLDTLPDNVDPHTLDIISASAAMYLSIVNIGGHNIAKFDFPNIKLLDSSHHGLCDGMFIFKIKTRPGLADGTYIPNRVGIYFDDNEVVMTNTAGNTILIPSVSISAAPGSVCTGNPATFNTTARTFGSPHYKWYVNGVLSGTDSAAFTSASLNNGDAITCKLVNPAGDSVFAISNVVLASISPLPSTATLSGATAVCAGASATVTSSVSGGIWFTDNTNATVTAGSVTGVTAGTVTISYAVSNSCGTATVTRIVTVNPLPNAGTLSGATFLCTGVATTLSSTQPGGSWTASNSNATASAAGVITGVVAGTVVISYSVTNSCGTAMAVRTMTVDPSPSLATLTGSSTVCEGASATLTPSLPGGIWSTDNTNATVTAGSVTGVTAGTVTISYTASNICGTATITRIVTVNPLANAGTLSGATSVCTGAATTLSSSQPGGSWTASNSNAAAAVASGVISGVTAGTVVISYSVTNSCGPALAVRLMTVNTLPAAGAISGASSVCVSATTALTASVSGGTWSSGSTNASVSASGIVTGISAGTSTISYAVTNMCGTTTASHAVTVNPLPVAGTLSGGSAICPSGVTTLTPSVPGGTWSASNTNATVASGVVTGVSSGTVEITYAVTSACGTATATYPITINALPVAGIISGAASVCEGASTVLTSSVPGGIWISGGSGATVGSGLVSGVSAGAVIISYQVTNTCGIAIAMHSMTVNPLPIAGTLTGVSNLCKGQITTLTASVPGGIWSTSGSTATVSAGMVLGNTAGVAIISYAVSNMCGTAYATLPITIDPLPVAGSITGASTVATAGTITLTNAVAGGAWSSSATGIASVNSGGQVTGISPGIADIYYTVANNCGAAMATHSITVYPATQVALSHAGTGINIYPNPATSEITVEYAKDCTIRILNLLGQEVYHDRLSRDSQQINIANLASSVYTIQVIRDNGEKITMRLVKE